ncbi:hypothetical protein U1Q18_023694 [Sarracenia purpurea var. burkii]
MLGATLELSGVRLSSPDLVPLIGSRSGLSDPSSGLHKVRISRPHLWYGQGSDSPTSPLVCTRLGFPDLTSGLALYRARRAWRSGLRFVFASERCL